jgi:hypothetical protein
MKEASTPAEESQRVINQCQSMVFEFEGSEARQR